MSEISPHDVATAIGTLRDLHIQPGTTVDEVEDHKDAAEAWSVLCASHGLPSAAMDAFWHGDEAWGPPCEHDLKVGLVIGEKTQQSAMERDETQGRQNGLDSV